MPRQIIRRRDHDPVAPFPVDRTIQKECRTPGGQRLRQPDPARPGIRRPDVTIRGAFFAKKLQCAAVGNRQHLVAEKSWNRTSIVVWQGMILVEIIIGSPSGERDFCGTIGAPYLQRNTAGSGGGIFGRPTDNSLPAIALTRARALIWTIEVDRHESAASADGLLRCAGANLATISETHMGS
jgi:hypothetical protein